MASRTKGRAVPQRHTTRPWLWLGALALVVLAGTALALTGFGRGRAGALVAEQSTYDFGTVSMRNGEITTTFPVSVREPTVVTDVNSS